MPYDDTEFVDREFPSPHVGTAASVRPGAGTGGRAPTREELDSQLTATQQQLAKLREVHEQLERAKSELEEMRRRRAEFQTGRGEMRDELTRGIALLEKAEFDARRDAEQMARSLEGLRGALGTVESVRDEAWTESNWNQELGKGLAIVENARMEWNSARLKWPVLGAAASADQPSGPAASPSLASLPFGQLCRVGLAFTWPLVLLGAAGVAAIVVAVAMRR
jgi:hypothetical protein